MKRITSAAFILVLSFVLSACERTFFVPRSDAPKIIPIHVAFGYKDARPARFVGDRYERIYFIEQLLNACHKLKNQACGFSRSPDDGNLLIKNLPSRPPVVIKIHISGSSAGPDDDQNRKDPYQKILSQKSEANFLGGVNKGEATFYIGHSRDGGGPDFAPPIMTKGNHVNYPWYRNNCPGLNLLKEALARGNATRKKKKPILALLSCASAEHFNQGNLGGNLELHTVKGLIYYSEALDRGLSEISNYLTKELATTTAGTGT